MKKNMGSKIMVSMLVVGVLTVGSLTFADTNNWNDNFHFGMMGEYNEDNNFSNGYGHMMGGYGWGEFQDFDVEDLKPIDELTENVKEYLGNFNGDFEIEDIFIYSNSDYYFSIVEKETGRGAMELLVNPVSGYVYPEHGPNMMWNIEYGMHGNRGYGGRMGMMRGFNYEVDEENEISVEDALEKANDYLSELDGDLTAKEGGHAFYGYYTFHVNEGEALKGMMSVNAYTGDVWYHNWHGDLVDIISVGH